MNKSNKKGKASPNVPKKAGMPKMPARQAAKAGKGRPKGDVFDVVMSTPSITRINSAVPDLQVWSQPLSVAAQFADEGESTPLLSRARNFEMLRLSNNKFKVVVEHGEAVAGFTATLYYVHDSGVPQTSLAKTNLRAKDVCLGLEPRKGGVLQIPQRLIDRRAGGFRRVNMSSDEASDVTAGRIALVIHGRPMNQFTGLPYEGPLYTIEWSAHVQCENWQVNNGMEFVPALSEITDVTVRMDSDGSAILSVPPNITRHLMLGGDLQVAPPHFAGGRKLGKIIGQVLLNAGDAAATVLPPPFNSIAKGALWFVRAITGLKEENEIEHLYKLYATYNDAMDDNPTRTILIPKLPDGVPRNSFRRLKLA